MSDVSVQTSTWLLNDTENGLDTKDLKKDTKKDSKKWAQLHPVHKGFSVCLVLMKIALLLCILYFFVCALGLLEDSFQLLGGRAAGEAFRNSDVLVNPIAGLMIGVLATVLVQSSSTATSIVVAMVASEVIPIRSAIPVIMGTNVGTSVTSTLVSLAQVGDRTEFRRAFAGATVHDMFNWSAVLVLLPLEIAFSYLYYLTKAIVTTMNLHSKNVKFEFLSALTRPFTRLIVEINEEVITDIAMAPNITEESLVMKRWCQVTVVQRTVSVMRYAPVLVNCRDVHRDSPFYSSCTGIGSADDSGISNIVGLYRGWNDTEVINTTVQRSRCTSLFALTDMGDKAAGVLTLILSIIVILSSLFGIVKILNSMLKGSVAKVINKTMNTDFPGKFAYLTGYLAFFVGMGMTIVIQSSSVFTSTLTPLVGVGIVSLDRMYPMTLGSNVGTTVTGIMAAMSIRGPYIGQALQIALCHLFFNVTAVLLFYPIPFMRFPIPMAKTLGRVTSKYRWFAGVYLIGMFLVLPSAIFALSFVGWVYLVAVGGPIFFIFIVATVVNVLQVKRPNWLPRGLRSWEFLPKFLHSCAPYDVLISCRIITDRCPKFEDKMELSKTLT
ncbi:sodium-dependent phosphate transport protein 2B-like [Biomphalaria glabrata]|uniref:Sodium-dependent phosphate transport protein 2B-like n=1 Tax=Biomphalaria glabrata TaxID=6526 RepID=A0A9W3AXV1_BIOGL|nr:sodium-dependent phosphate transport protein 2B-like [Biomphalaria glabrata]KAI8762130.1 sodium-dependent phosphate transport protein 2B [Biomphalaria glabrata]